MLKNAITNFVLWIVADGFTVLLWSYDQLLWRDDMLQKNFALDTPVKQAEFAVREDHTLALQLSTGSGNRTLVFHDFLQMLIFFVH